VSFALEQVAAAPDLWRELMDESIRATDAGAPVYPQVAARPFGMLLGFPGHHAYHRTHDCHQVVVATGRKRAGGS